MKPLAIDLFCGLFEAEFLVSADTAVKQFVTRGAQYPNHVALRVGGQSPSAITLELWAVRNFKNAVFTTRLARLWDSWVSTFQAVDSAISKLPLGFIDRPADFIFSRCPRFAQISCGLGGTLTRTISLIRVRLLYRKMVSASRAIATSFSCSLVFGSPESSSALGAITTAPFLVGTDRLKALRALAAKQVVHFIGIPV